MSDDDDQSFLLVGVTDFTSQTLNGATQIGVGVGDTTVIGGTGATTSIVNANLSGTTTFSGVFDTTGTLSFAGSALDFTGATVVGLPPPSFNNSTLTGTTNIGVAVGENSNLGNATGTLNLIRPTSTNQRWVGTVITTGTVTFAGSSLDFTGATVVGLPPPSFNNATLTGTTNIGVAVGENTNLGNATGVLSLNRPVLLNATWSGTVNTAGLPVTFVGSILDFTGATVTGLPPPSFNNTTLTGTTNIGVAALENTNIGNATGLLNLNRPISTNATWAGTVTTAGPVTFAGSILDFTGAAVTGLPPPVLNNSTLTGTSNIGVAAGENTNIGNATGVLALNRPVSTNQTWVGTVNTAGLPVTFVGSILDFTGASVSGLPPPSFNNVTLTGTTNIGIAAGENTNLGNATGVLALNRPVLLNSTWSGTVNTAGLPVTFVGSILDFTGATVTGLPPPSFNNVTLTGTTNMGVGIGETNNIGSALGTTNISSATIPNGLTFTPIAANPGGVNTVWNDSVSGYLFVGARQIVLQEGPVLPVVTNSVGWADTVLLQPPVMTLYKQGNDVYGRFNFNVTRTGGPTTTLTFNVVWPVGYDPITSNGAFSMVVAALPQDVYSILYDSTGLVTITIPGGVVVTDVVNTVVDSIIGFNR